MHERDFLMRLIAQSAKMLGVVMGLREQKKQEEALVLTDEFLGRELRLKSRIALGLSDENLLRMLSTGEVLNAESVYVLSAFLQEEAELLSDLGRMEEALPRFEKALRLNLHLIKVDAVMDGFDTLQRTDRLLSSITGSHWEADTVLAVMNWHEREGRFAEAENVLFELLEFPDADAAEGWRFYERLSLETDDRLEAGGLPRDELESGLREWQRLAERIG